MEFFGGVLVTLFFGFIGYKIYESRKRKKERQAYVPPSGPRPNIPRGHDQLEK